jgi:hypothetical protein
MRRNDRGENPQEWMFRPVLVPDDQVNQLPRSFAEEALLHAVRWAEQQNLGVGGGFRQTVLEGYWRLEFGLCATAPNQTVSQLEAQELLESLRQFCAEHGVSIRGGFAEYPAENDLRLGVVLSS